MKRFTCCELDATFYCLRPYVVCVPEFVYMNTSYPVGIFMRPSENLDVYNLFDECFIQFMENLPNDQRYATEANMLQWIDGIVVPYVEGVTSRLPDQEDKVYLIIDNCGIHNSTNMRKR